MKTLKYNGEQWYWDERSLWKRCRQWLIWIGGWEKANGKGWEFTVGNGKYRHIMNPTPISLFGHRVTCYGWGWRVRLRNCSLSSSESGIYISSDGRPPDIGGSGFYIWKRKRRHE